MTREHIAQLIRSKGNYCQPAVDGSLRCAQKPDGSGLAFSLFKEEHWEIVLDSGRKYLSPAGSDVVLIATDLLGDLSPTGPTLQSLPATFINKYGLRAMA